MTQGFTEDLEEKTTLNIGAADTLELKGLFIFMIKAALEDGFHLEHWGKGELFGETAGKGMIQEVVPKANGNASANMVMDSMHGP